MDARTQYDHTALHWACVYAHPAVVEELIIRYARTPLLRGALRKPLFMTALTCNVCEWSRGCDTSTVNHRGKTAWDIAEVCDCKEVLAVFDFFASLPALHYPAFNELRQERARRIR